MYTSPCAPDDTVYYWDGANLVPATKEAAEMAVKTNGSIMGDGLTLLRKPFEPHLISKLPKPTKQQTDEVKADFKKGIRCTVCGAWHHPNVIHLDYVGHAALTDRLLDVDMAWSWEPLALGENGLPVLDGYGGMWIRLTVLGVTRLGYGHAGDKTGGDAIKEVIGDALRNAAMRFGAALDLWHKGDLHADPPPPPNPPPGSGADVKKQAFAGLQPEVQDALRKAAKQITDAAATDVQKAISIAGMALDNWPEEDRNELKLSLWHLLDSKTRSAIDAQQKR
jgi:hypothetical protein